MLGKDAVIEEWSSANRVGPHSKRASKHSNSLHMQRQPAHFKRSERG